MDSTRYPLEINLIDLPHPFIMEEICMEKSLMELEDILEAANIFNLLAKIKETRHPELKCPRCSSNNAFPTIPDGYYSVLSRDKDLHSQNKIKYMMSEIDNIVKKTPKGKLLLVLSNEYAPFIRESLKKYSESGKLDHEHVTL